MLRCGISVHGQALELGTVEYFMPAQVPEDVQLQTESYPVVLPKEAGEKAFVVQEDLNLGTDIKQIILPAALTEIDEGVFSYCSSLETISFAGSLAQWESVKKGDNWRASTPAFTVKCTDGEVDYPENTDRYGDPEGWW